MFIEIVAIGDEVLSGAIVNTNASYLSRRLSEEGWEVSRHSVVGDNPDQIFFTIQEALKRKSFVITTGGLGPTLDDITAECASKLYPEPPQKMANRVGAAEGMLYPSLALLPGVPREMEAMFEENILPYLRKTFPPKERFSAVLHLCLQKEQEVDPLLRELKNVQAGIYPGYGVLTVRLHAKEKMALENARQKIENAFGDFLYPSKSGKIEEAIHGWFTQNRKTLALAESCTGGMMSSHLTQLAGASEYFLGSFVTYSNELKEKILGVKRKTLEAHGAVSGETVKEMLAGLFKNTVADYGIAVSGIAGPSGGSPDKPVGTVWYALGKRGEDPEIATYVSPAKTRELIILHTTNRLFGILWKSILKN